MDWKLIPSLSALRAFEATARCGSFVGAAAELNVTDAAIRQHVRALETHFGLALVKREGRGITCTKFGEELASGLRAGFERIQTTIEEIQDKNARKPVRVALTPAFAENWLIPRLPQFWSAHPEIQVDLAPSLKNVDMEAGNYDLAIRYGKGDWGQVKTRFLASADYTIVASSQLALPMVADISELRDAVWLFEGSRQEHRDWADSHGLDFDARQNRLYPNNSMVLSAVRAGHGYSVQAYALVQSDLAIGALASVFRERVSGLGYYLLSRDRPREDALIFATWMNSVSLRE